MAKSRISATDREDMQTLIRMMLDSPVRKGGATARIDGITDISSFAKANTDVKTRMLVQIGIGAMNGDLKCAEFMMKYGGLEPVKESHVTVATPTFVDDLQMVNVTPAPVQVECSDVPYMIDRPGSDLAPAEELPVYTARGGPADGE